MDNEKKIFVGGLEATVDGVAVFYLILSILLFVVCVGIATGDEAKVEHTSAIWIAAGVISVIQGITFWVVGKIFAEILRLLKKQNGVQYSGEISETVLRDSNPPS